MGPQMQTVFYLTVGALAFLPIVRASCNNEFDNNDCGFGLSRGAAFGIGLGVLVLILGLLMLMRWRRQRQVQKANLALIRVSQNQQGNNYQGPTPNYQPNHANYNPNYIPNQSYPDTPDGYYPPPPGPPPPRGSKGRGNPGYDPTNAPQYPPPTYNV